MKDAYLHAMSRAANSVTIVTTDGPAGRHGVTVSAMCSVSVEDPAPRLLVCVHSLSPACAAIRENGLFCTNLLSEDQAHISDHFAGRSGAKGADKFSCATWHRLSTGAPVLVNALAAFDCRVVDDPLVGSHRIFIGELTAVEATGSGKPLVYHDRAYRRPTDLVS